MTAKLTVRIPRGLKELMDMFGIKPGPIIRRALESEVRKKILEEAEEKARELSKKLRNITDEEIAELIREGRELR